MDPKDPLTPMLLNRVYGKLSPDAIKILKSVAQARGSTPEEVLREALKGYLATEVPSIDIEGIVKSLKPGFRQAGFAVGRAAALFRRWRESD